MAVNTKYGVPNSNGTATYFGGEVGIQEDNIYVWTANYTVPTGGLYYLEEFGVGYKYYTGDATHVEIRLRIETGTSTLIIPLYVDYVAGTTRGEGIVKTSDVGFTKPIYLPANTNIYCEFTFAEATAISPVNASAYFWGNIYNYYTA